MKLFLVLTKINRFLHIPKVLERFVIIFFLMHNLGTGKISVACSSFAIDYFLQNFATN